MSRHKLLCEILASFEPGALTGWAYAEDMRKFRASLKMIYDSIHKRCFRTDDKHRNPLFETKCPDSAKILEVQGNVSAKSRGAPITRGNP
jgi:hypothetical protein